MDSQRANGPVCEICKKKFTSVSIKNRHMKNIHNKPQVERKSKHILCPLCPKEGKELLACYEDLEKHLTHTHKISIKESLLHFRSLKEFQAWRTLENREIDYVCHRKKKGANGEEYIYYNCNRSDSKGFVSASRECTVKYGGSIRISGVCPSRMTVKIFKNGSVTVKFNETHVGHCDKLSTKRLSKGEQEIIVGQLIAGVTNDKIIKDARRIRNSKLKRRNITRGNLAYLIRKFNIDKKRDADDMNEPTKSQINQKEEIRHFIGELNQNTNTLINFEERREIALQEICNYGKTLDEESFAKFMDVFRDFKNNLDRKNNVMQKT